ncbi:MAG: translational machinery protein [Pseudomonadota bacterium]
MSENVAVWIDHKEARICRVFAGMAEEAVIAAPHHVHHNHPRGQEGVKARPEDVKRFFQEVVESLEDSTKVLLLGPSTAKLELLKYAQTHHPALALKVVGVETADHPTDGQLVAHAKAYFGRVGSSVGPTERAF